MDGILTHPRVLSLNGHRTLPTAVPGHILRDGRGGTPRNARTKGKAGPQFHMPHFWYYCACVQCNSTARSYKGERGFPSYVHHTRVVIFYRLRFLREGRGGLRLVRAGGRWRGVSFDVYATCFCIASMTYLSTQSERVGSASSPSTYSART